MRSVGRVARRQALAGRPAAPYLVRKIAPFAPYNEDALAHVEDKADELLRDVGMEFRGDPESLALWRNAGADVKGERVRLDKGMARHIISATAPRSFTQHARNPARSVEMGGNALVFCPAYGMPFVSTLEEERRYARLDDLRNLVRLAYLARFMHHSGGVICEPVDVPVPLRHLEMNIAHLTLSDKPFLGVATAGSRAADTIEMARIAAGVTDDRCLVASIININSPLVLDHTMLEALRVYAAANQANVVTPFVMAGAMGPVSVAGMVTQILAEALAGCALTQLVRPGAPVILGVMMSGLNMRSGAPMRGAETWHTMAIMGALARRLGIPYRVGGATTTSKALDLQAGQESADMLMATVLSGVNFLIHAAGHMESGLCMSYEKFVLDCDHLGQLARFVEGVDFSEPEFAMDAFREVGPGQHYLGAAHTLERYADAFYIPELVDTDSYEQWSDGGRLCAAQRANASWKAALARYVPPILDISRAEALNDFVAKRRAAIMAEAA